MNFELSIGRLHLHACIGEVDNDETEIVDLHSETRVVGFQPNNEWEDDDESLRQW